MRHRSSNSSPVDHAITCVYYDTQGRPTSLPTYHWIFPEVQSEIWDIPSKGWFRTRGGGSKLYMKPCTQSRMNVSVAKPTRVYCNPPPYTDAVEFTPMYQYWGGIEPAILAASPNGFDFAKHLENLLIGERTFNQTDFYNQFESAKPTMTTRANLTTFLYELKDISSMFKVIPPKHFNVSNWRHVLSYANGQHLNYNFGWKPFISDVRKLFSATKNWETRLDKFVQNQGQSLHRNRRNEYEFSVPKTRDISWPAIQRAGTNEFWKWYFQGSGTRVNASSYDYSYQLPQYSKTEMKIRGLLDTLGINVTPATIWQVLPWSFVVDWFYDVEGYLKLYGNDWIVPYIIWEQSCCSYQIEYEGSWWMENSRGQKLPGIEVNAHYYNRRVGATPNFSGTTDPLSADKIRLGGSLILGRLL